MKSIFLIVIGIVAGMFIRGMNGASSQVTYSDKGMKTVVAICDKNKDCHISIGQECGDTGFKVVETDHDDMKTILTAECGKVKDKSLSFGF